MTGINFTLFLSIGAIILNRQTKIWLHPDIIFRFTKDYKTHQECIKTLHGFSYKVIRERKEQIRNQNLLIMNGDNGAKKFDENGNEIFVNKYYDDDESLGKKKRLAFLDLLITASGNGTILTDEDIREEVDTFVRQFFKILTVLLNLNLFLDVRRTRHNISGSFLVSLPARKQSEHSIEGPSRN